MLKLISIELKKLFHKKSIYIIFFLMTIFCILNNVLYYKDYNEEGFYKYEPKENLKEQKENLEKEISNYNLDNSQDKIMYITIKSKIELIELKEKYPQTSWQYHRLNNNFYDLIYKKNYYKYILHEENNIDYNTKIEKLSKNNWEYFINEDIKNEEEKKNTILFNLKNEKDKQNINNLKQDLKNINNNIKILKYRKINNIKEEKTYLNKALEDIEKNKIIVNNLKNNKLTHEEQISYNNAKSELELNKYILKHKQNINKENTLNYELRTISEDYELFIVILILIIATNSICEEFTKGTIKLLLIKPYSRVKILISKYLSCLIILVLCLLFLISLELLIGIPLFKTNSLKIPVVVYHLGKKKIIEYSIWKYMLIRIIARLPFFIILLTICYCISVLTTNNVLGIILPMIIYLFTPTIEQLIIKYNINYLKYLININWNLEKYLFGQISIIPNITLKISLIVCITHFIVLLFITIIIFKRKDIKNI